MDRVRLRTLTHVVDMVIVSDLDVEMDGVRLRTLTLVTGSIEQLEISM